MSRKPHRLVADGVNLPEVVRRTVEANTKFYRGWLELSLDYFRGITEILDPDGQETSAEAPQELEPELGALILEAEGGQKATGAFLVTNDLGKELKCALTTSAFVGVDDKTVRPKVSFKPASVTLKPGEQKVVQASLTISKAWASGAALTGEFGIRGMDGFSVPVVLRRLDQAGGAPTERSPIDQLTESAKAQPTGSRKKASRKQATKKASGAKKSPVRSKRRTAKK